MSLALVVLNVGDPVVRGQLYDCYSTLFPPGEPDASARERAYKLAMQTGCEIDNQPDEQTVWFVKHDPADPAKA
jgi:hypothetical protein